MYNLSPLIFTRIPVIAKQIPTTMTMPIINYVSLNSVPYAMMTINAYLNFSLICRPWRKIHSKYWPSARQRDICNISMNDR